MAPSPNNPEQSRDKLLLESLDEPIIAARLDGTIIAWSRGAEHLYGWSRAEATGCNVDELLHSVPPAAENVIRSALLGPERRWSGHIHHRRRDGARIAINSRRHLVTDPDGQQTVVSCDRDLSATSRISSHSLDHDPRLADLRERFQFSADAAQIGYWFCDLPFSELIWDDRVREHFWFPPGVPVDIDKFYAALHPGDRDRTRAALDAAIVDRTTYDIEYRTVASDGREKWIRAVGRTAYAADGTPLRFDGITQDITAVKRAEADLRESRAQITAFADSIPALAWMAEAQGSIVWYNRRWYEYTGTRPEDMQGWGWQSVLDPAALPAVTERWTHSIRTGEPFEMTFPLRGADGVFRSFLTRITPARNEQGEIVRWFGTNTEVDELERTRQQLQFHEERIRVVLSTVPILLYTTDLDLRYTWVYTSAQRQYDAIEMVGRTDLEVDPERFKAVHEFKRSVLASGQPARREIRYDFDGRIEIYNYTAEPLRDTNGAIVGLTVAALEVTQMRLAEEALRKSEKLAIVGRLAASIAHEINNPLEAVVSLIYVARSMATDDELRGYLETAEQELYRVAHVVTHSLRFHRQSNAATECRVSSLMDSAMALYRGRLKSSEIRLTTDFRDPQPILCFANELRQVFANLLGNAFEATRSGQIILRTRIATDSHTGQPGIRAIVADTGHGIDARTREHLFEPFVTTKGEFGTGLGLWVSAEILRRHHATVRIKTSTAPSHSGTVFSIFFPISAGSPSMQPRSEDLPILSV